MATLVIRSLSANPVKAVIDFAGQTFSLEYQNKQAALDKLTELPDPDTQLELALMFVLREWKKTDPNLNNLAGLVNKTCTIALPVVTIT